MDCVVKLVGNEPVTSTQIIADGMKLEHRAVMSLVDKYKSDLEEFGLLTFQMSKVDRKKMGRPIRFAWVNEQQATFLISLMRNSDIVVKFKKLLTKEFYKQKQLIAQLVLQRKNSQWIEQREQGKLSRKEETDTIKEFIVYSKKQGSVHADKYYMLLSKMENKALFLVKERFPNMRDILTGQQLQILAAADIAVSKAIREGMDQGLAYQNIYQLAKERMQQFADIVGQSIVPHVQFQQQIAQ